MMELDRDTRTRIYIDMTLDIDPTGTTIELQVDDDEWRPATWQGTPVAAAGRWTQTARTVDYFAGPNVETPDGAVVLAAGRHKTQTRVTSGGDILAEDANTIEVD